MSRTFPGLPESPDDPTTFEELDVYYWRKMAQANRRVRRLEVERATALGRLTERQRRFCEACGTRPGWGKAYRAAATAGYAWPRSQGPRLVAMPRVRRVLDLTMEIHRVRWDLEHHREALVECRELRRETDRREAAAERRVGRLIAERMGTAAGLEAPPAEGPSRDVKPRRTTSAL